MPPVTSDRQPSRGAIRMSRRAMLKATTALTVITGVPLLVQQSITGQDAPAPSEATPSASPHRPLASPRASPPGVAAAAVGFTVDLRFDPEVLTIVAGTTVTWTNNSPMPHTATGDPDQNPVAASHPEYIALPDGAKPWGSAMLQPGDSFTYVFDVPGEYRYICIPHVMAGMRGTIVVEG